MANIKKLFRLALKPKMWPAMALKVAPTIEHDGVLSTISPDCVIDVGANKGQFAAYAAARWPKALLYCFEPLATPRALLTKVLERVAPGRHKVFGVALGSSNGQAEIHVTSRDDASSLLHLVEQQKRFFGIEETGTEIISVRRLDDLPDVKLNGDCLLKIDVQGLELEVLKGAAETLRSMKYLYVELSYLTLYEGQALAPEVISYLKDHGFDAVRRTNEALDGERRLLQADVLFTRQSG